MELSELIPMVISKVIFDLIFVWRIFYLGQLTPLQVPILSITILLFLLPILKTMNGLLIPSLSISYLFPVKFTFSYSKVLYNPVSIPTPFPIFACQSSWLILFSLLYISVLNQCYPVKKIFFKYSSLTDVAWPMHTLHRLTD